MPEETVQGEVQRRRTLRALSAVGLFPNKLFLYNPLKIQELDELLGVAEIARGDRILDIGCGRGIQSLILAKKAKHVIGVDISDASISAANNFLRVAHLDERAEFRKVDIMAAPFSPHSFERIVSFSVLEHLPTWEEILRLARKWLTPEGKLVISVDSLSSITDSKVLETHRSRSGVVHYFDVPGLKSALEGAGFENVKVFPVLRSAYARELFAATVTKGVGFTLLSGYRQYRRLRKEERRSGQGNGGIFLIAVATPGKGVV
jgi:2-polyprenyl-3-methyl-5-hydroxy-6-metoxy-1,4-benzoquinol methylase